MAKIDTSTLPTLYHDFTDTPFGAQVVDLKPVAQKVIREKQLKEGSPILITNEDMIYRATLQKCNGIWQAIVHWATGQEYVVSNIDNK
jgi:hypothetical protein